MRAAGPTARGRERSPGGGQASAALRPEPETAEGAPDFGAGLPDEVLRRLLLACAAEGQLAFETAVVRWDRKALTEESLFT